MYTSCAAARKHLWSVAGVSLLLLAAGCGGSRGTVSGKVRYGDQPLNGGTVAFFPEKGNPVTAPIQQDGSYEAFGVPAGVVKIAVDTPPPMERPGPKPNLKDMPTDLPPGAEREFQTSVKLVQVPKSYADPKTSGLSLTVTGGRQTHDIVLEKGKK